MVALVAALCVTSSAQAATNYIYDSLGRITTVIYSNGSVIDYQYDANGNVTIIQRDTSDALSILSVAPTATYIGSSITIVGSGFNADTAQDAVAIGGVTATVTTATNTTLVVTVPSTAISGPVTVTVNGTTLTSSQTVTILRPTITTLLPTVANSGDTVTLQGTNLDLVPGGTTVSVGSVTAAILSISNTSITFTAPDSSGIVTVSTSYGQSSTSSLVVLPSTLSAASVASAAILDTSGTTQNLDVSQSNKYGVYEFNATQGQMLSIQLSSVVGGTINYQIYSPSNSSIASGSVSAINPSIHLPTIPTTGMYLAVFSSSGTFQISAQLELNTLAPIDGASIAIATTAPDQSKRWIFTATAGDNIGVEIGNLVEQNSHYNELYVYVYRPDGSMWVNANACYVS
ncbi:MAG TPA: IPT/TIG domain-containing protein, partial [Steroidobacteraceae bacterium]|nr:IPT/TIG domain-containing protein [Steroidobacteraceae bacterium]